MQIPLLSGTGATEQAEFTDAYPVNLEAIGLENGISRGQLRSAPGAKLISTGPGTDRGAILWNGQHLRVMGSKLVTVDRDGLITVRGDVGTGFYVSWARGFDRVALRSENRLYYWDGYNLTQVTDPDLGNVVDVAWLNGQFFTTDGTDILAADITDPTNFTATRYGAAEADPDGVSGLIVSRNEMFVTGTSTIEVQTYVGGTNFPLQANLGATIPKGCVNANAKCLYSQTFAFIGAGFNEQPGIYLQDGASAQKISTRTIDKMLAAVTDFSTVEMESRASDNEERLLVHLPDATLVFLFAASKSAQQQVWYVAKSGRQMDKPYRLRHPVLAYGKWWVGDTETGALGVLTDDAADHFGEAVGWQFQTTFSYNQGRSFIVHGMELVGLFGRGVAKPNAAFWSYSKDGETWSIERASKLPAAGVRTNRVTWNPHTRFRNYGVHRFRGDSDSLLGIAALNVPDDQIEALSA